MADGDRITMTAMEEALRNDPDGRYRDAIVDELSARIAAVRRTLDRGLSPAEFQRLSLLKDAMEAASTVVPKVWRRLNTAHR